MKSLIQATNIILMSLMKYNPISRLSKQKIHDSKECSKVQKTP